jgi:hypothetical protein
MLLSASRTALSFVGWMIAIMNFISIADRRTHALSITSTLPTFDGERNKNPGLLAGVV